MQFIFVCCCYTRGRVASFEFWSLLLIWSRFRLCRLWVSVAMALMFTALASPDLRPRVYRPRVSDPALVSSQIYRWCIK